MLGATFILSILLLLVAVAFFTLTEVRLLGAIHIRPGPNKVGVMGYLQPFSDFIKLFSKKFWIPFQANSLFYLTAPVLAVIAGVSVWTSYMSEFSLIHLSWSSILFFCLSSLVVFFLLFSGWSSGSSYSALGSFRSAAQSISYEVVMIFVVFALMFFNQSFNLMSSMSFMKSIYSMLYAMPLFMIWVISCLAESSRAPFDFSEGESELVSGFNTEYMGGMFAFIFIAEYSFMLFLSFLTALLFMGGGALWIKSMAMVAFFIVTRGAFPRLRFDWLMYTMWKSILPTMMFAFMFSMATSFT